MTNSHAQRDARRNFSLAVNFILEIVQQHQVSDDFVICLPFANSRRLWEAFQLESLPRPTLPESVATYTAFKNALTHVRRVYKIKRFTQLQDTNNKIIFDIVSL